MDDACSILQAQGPGGMKVTRCFVVAALAERYQHRADRRGAAFFNATPAPLISVRPDSDLEFEPGANAVGAGISKSH
jgi:hypothetical protein